MLHELTRQRHTGFVRAALLPDDIWLSWIRVERTSGGSGLTTNGQASGCRLEKTNGRLDASGGKGETGFAKQGLYRDSARERCRPPGLWRFLFLHGSSWLRLFGESCRPVALQAKYYKYVRKHFNSRRIEIGYECFDMEVEKGRDASPEYAM